MLEFIAQLGIVVTGVLCVFLVAFKNRWGPVWGLIGEPFWLYTAVVNKQWGIIALTVIYTVGWGLGVYKWWFKKETK